MISYRKFWLFLVILLQLNKISVISTLIRFFSFWHIFRQLQLIFLKKNTTKLLNDWIFSWLRFYYDLGPMTVSRLPTYSTSYLSDIFLTIELSNKKNIHMLNIPYIRQKWCSTSQLSDLKVSILRHSACPTLYPHIGLPKMLVYFITFRQPDKGMAPVSSKEFLDIHGLWMCGSYGFTLKRVRDKIRTYSQMHQTDKYSRHSPII